MSNDHLIKETTRNLQDHDAFKMLKVSLFDHKSELITYYKSGNIAESKDDDDDDNSWLEKCPKIKFLPHLDGAARALDFT